MATMETMKEAVAMSREQLDQAKTQREKYADLIEQLRAKNIKLQAKEELAATINRLKIEDTSSQFATVHELFERLNKRLEVENKYLDQKIGLARMGSDVGTGAQDIVGRDASAEIAVALDLNKADQIKTLPAQAQTTDSSENDPIVSADAGQ
jgi:hypothetical protein